MKWGVAIGVLLLSPLYALAAGTSFFGPLVPPCTEYGGAVPICQACNAIQLVDNILRFFVSLAVMIAALMFAYAGFLYVSASSNKQNIDSAKKIFVNVFIGLIFVVAAYLIVDMTLKVLTGTPLSVLSQIQCVKMETTTGSIKYTVVPGQNPVTGTQGEETTPSSGGGGDPVCQGGQKFSSVLPSFTGTTNYKPGGGGMQGPDKDAYNGIPYTVEDCKRDYAAGKQCQPITVAAPQDIRDQCGLRGKDVVEWEAARQVYGLPPGTKFKVSDVYGCYWKDPNDKSRGSDGARYDPARGSCQIGRTSTGYSMDVAVCAPQRQNCGSYKTVTGGPPPVLLPGG
jgi:hypothetical protein